MLRRLRCTRRRTVYCFTSAPAVGTRPGSVRLAGTTYGSLVPTWAR